MGSNKLVYVSSGTVTCTLASLASSATWVAGRSAAEESNASNLNPNSKISGFFTVGTTPTAGTVFEAWAAPKLEDGSYALGFDGTDKNLTVVREQLVSYCRLIASVIVPVTTSNLPYAYWNTVAGIFGDTPPEKFQRFFVHNTGVALNSTGGNHVQYRKDEYWSY